MSQLNIKTVKLGDNIDPTKNFLIKAPAVADGTLSIQRENGTPVLNIDATGKIVDFGDLNVSSNLGVGITPSGFRIRTKQTGGSTVSSIFETDQTASYIGFRDAVNNDDVLIRVGSSGNNLTFITNSTERMRITNTGNINIGSASFSSGLSNIQIGPSSGTTAFGSPGTSTYNHMSFHNANGGVGSITTTGTTTSFNTSSDYRLKENVAPIADHFQKIQALKPVTYSWKVDGSEGRGFIAHELQEVFPLAVTGQKDELDEEGKPKYQAMDASFIIADLVACVQELKKELDSVKQELAALKGA